MLTRLIVEQWINSLVFSTTKQCFSTLKEGETLCSLGLLVSLVDKNKLDLNEQNVPFMVSLAKSLEGYFDREKIRQLCFTECMLNWDYIAAEPNFTVTRFVTACNNMGRFTFPQIGRWLKLAYAT